MFQASVQSTDAGPLFSLVDVQSGRRASLMLPTFPEGTPLATTGVTLSVALNNFAGNVQTAVAQFLPGVVPQHMQQAVINVLRKPAVAFQSAAIAEQQAIAKAKAVSMTIDPATLSTAPIRAHAVRLFDAADVAGRAAVLLNFNLEQLAGVIESGAIDQVPPDVAEIGNERYMLLRHVARTGLQASFQRAPTPIDPLASGADTGAAMAAAQASLDALNARSDDVDAAANVLRNVIIVAALACELPVDAAFALLMGN